MRTKNSENHTYINRNSKGMLIVRRLTCSHDNSTFGRLELQSINYCRECLNEDEEETLIHFSESMASHGHSEEAQHSEYFSLKNSGKKTLGKYCRSLTAQNDLKWTNHGRDSPMRYHIACLPSKEQPSNLNYVFKHYSM